MHVAAAHTSGWDIVAALGTLLLAATTAAAVVAALLLGAMDRRAAQDSLDQQLAADRGNRRRQHELELLIALAERLALMSANAEMPQGSGAGAHARAIAFALSDVRDMPALRLLFRLDPEASEDYHQTYGPARAHEIREAALREVTERIQWVAGTIG